MYKIESHSVLTLLCGQIHLMCLLYVFTNFEVVKGKRPEKVECSGYTPNAKVNLSEGDR